MRAAYRCAPCCGGVLHLRLQPRCFAHASAIDSTNVGAAHRAAFSATHLTLAVVALAVVALAHASAHVAPNELSFAMAHGGCYGNSQAYSGDAVTDHAALASAVVLDFAHVSH